MYANEVVKGELVHHSIYGDFVYRYGCTLCGRIHRSTSPELTVPTLCHYCYTGITPKTRHRTNQGPKKLK